MRVLLLLAVSRVLFAQGGADLQRELVGQWVGTLEYRDFSEPVGSTKRVKLPTWLTIDQQGEDLQFQYVYDDGPSKTVTETSMVHIDGTRAVWGKENVAVEGLDQLRQGRGTLTLRGPGTENKKPVEVKTTVRIARNLLEITRETGLLGEPLVFRHVYTFVRALSPALH